MAEPIFNQVRRIAADVLNVPASSIDERSSPETIESWDSMQHLNLALALEQHFHITLEPEEIESMTDIDKICQALREKIPSDS